MPEIFRRITYTIFFILVGPFIYLAERVKSLFMFLTNNSVRSFIKLYLKINIGVFVLFAVLGLSFYIDGIHHKSTIPTLMSNLRIEVVLITLFVSASIYYSKKFSSMPYKKGVKNGSYTKKK